MPGADPERSAPGVFMWGGCQNRLCLSFGERCVRVAGQIEMSQVVLPGVPGKSTEKQSKKLKNSIRKPATGQSWQRQTYLPRRLSVSDLLL